MHKLATRFMLGFVMCCALGHAQMPIMPKSSDPTVIFAAEELAKYLRMATHQSIAVILPGNGIRMSVEEGAANTGLKPFITLSVASDPKSLSPQVVIPELDDAYAIKINGANGSITGSNPRAVLLGVYRYLTEIGFRWVRPGVDGELIPSLTKLPDVSLTDAPSYRHRGVCIEGTNSVEHVKTLIDWMPKMGYNSYFVQFEQAYTFFDGWYAREGNPNVKGEHPTLEQTSEFVVQIEKEVAKRGMMYHKVGHGWTCLPFGIEALGWEQVDTPPPAEVVPFLAQVNGKRDYWQKTPLNTNLCYSNPEVRKRMTDFIVNYAEKHPIVDYLHVWLADDLNNHCECENCVKMRPSDWYLTLLNDIDAALTERQIKTRIVFLIYYDLLWPPEQIKLNNPDRFVLMFAPYTRSYSEPYSANSAGAEIPPYVRNKIEMPTTGDGTVAFLRAWQKQFTGDSFDYDYHLFSATGNPGQMKLTRVLYEDMKNLKALGLNGNEMCQPQRIFYPTGVLMTIMGRTLWNRDLSFDDIVSGYFHDAFGEDGAACRQYIDSLTTLYHAPSRGRESGDASASAGTVAPAKITADLNEALKVIEDFKPTIARNAYLTNPCQARSWQILQTHADFTRQTIAALLLKQEGKSDEAKAAGAALVQSVWDHEPDLQQILDVNAYAGGLRGMFEGRRRRNP